MKKKVSTWVVCAICTLSTYHSVMYHSFLRKDIFEIQIGGNTFDLQYVIITTPLIFIIGIAICLGWMIEKKELSKKIKLVTLGFLAVALMYFYLEASYGLIN